MSQTFPSDTDLLRTLTRHRDTVKPEWIDTNQHMGVPYYHVIINNAAWQAAEHWDFGIAYRERTKKSSFILEMHLRYLRELKLGDLVSTTVRITGLDDKRMLLYYEVYNERDNYLAATAEGLGISIDMETRRATPFEPDLYQRLTQVLEAHRRMEPLPLTRMLRLGPSGLERASLP